ncbi:hypothetical protein ACTFIW_004594 [Dictyostelium discoideum]
MNKDNGVNIDYANFRFHKEYFEWGYKCVNYDLSRIFAYKNIMALIHNIWVWICNQLYNDEPSKDEKLSYPNYLINDPVPEKMLPNIISFDQFI